MAVSAFQSGLEHNPDDPELKKAYMEACKLAEKTKSPAKSASGFGGFDKKMMGMMMELRYKSWVSKEVAAFH
jgi:hypothetical protein